MQTFYLMCFLLGWFGTQRCIIATAFQLCLRICHEEGSGKLGWDENEW